MRSPPHSVKAPFNPERLRKSRLKCHNGGCFLQKGDWDGLTLYRCAVHFKIEELNFLKNNTKMLDNIKRLWYIIARKDGSNVLRETPAPDVRMQGLVQREPRQPKSQANL